MSFASYLQSKVKYSCSSLLLTAPIYRVIEISRICESCCVAIGYHKLFADLYVILMVEFNVTLGMDWLENTRLWLIDYSMDKSLNIQLSLEL